MSLTTALAVIGAATGTASAVAQVVATMRDRPKLRLGMGFAQTAGSKPEAWIDVDNDGARATTVREVGFYAGPQSFETSRGVKASGAFKTILTSEPLFLEPGKNVRVKGNPDAVDAGFPADFPLRVYAIDQRGRYVWGNAAGVTRWLVGFDPPFINEPESFRRLFENRRGELKPAQVEPTWKLWKRKELRRPDTWRPTDNVKHFALKFAQRPGPGSAPD